MAVIPHMLLRMSGNIISKIKHCIDFHHPITKVLYQFRIGANVWILGYKQVA